MILLERGHFKEFFGFKYNFLLFQTKCELYHFKKLCVILNEKWIILHLYKKRKYFPKINFIGLKRKFKTYKYIYKIKFLKVDLPLHSIELDKMIFN